MRPPLSRLALRVGAVVAAALVAGSAAASGLAGIFRLAAPPAVRAGSVLPLLTAALVLLVGAMAATPCGSWWEGALDRHRRRRDKGRPGEQTSP